MVHPHLPVPSDSSPHNATAVSPTEADSAGGSTGGVIAIDRHDHRDEPPSEAESMDYWLQRCSICFDAQLDLCLEYCRDQYCLDCFRRYVTNVVSSSWGLSVTKIRCPVCHDPIPQSEWSRFVPRSVVDLYNRFNAPYRSFSRCCPECEAEVIPCERTRRTHPRRVLGLLKELVQECNTLSHRHYHALKDITIVYERQEWSSSTLLDVYKRTMVVVKQFEHDHPYSNSNKDIDNATGSSSSCHRQQQQRAWAISKEVLLFDMKPDTWRKLQFAHIAQFPSIACPDCLVTFCLQCGNRDHTGATCEEYLRAVIASRKVSNEMLETFRWQLKHSRPCPSCSIMIQRDEGCNKVDCSLCGFSFCWACLSSWSECCGFYRCSRSAESGGHMNSYNNNDVPELSNAKTELGVPNISTIEARLYSGIHS